MRWFTAEIKKHEGIDGTYVEIPFDVEAVFGAKRVKVKASFDGAPYRGSIVRMGGCYMLGLTQQLRKATGKNPGDLIDVCVEKDEEERVVEMPDDFRLALERDQAARAFYDRLSFSHKKEYCQWIAEARRPDTRARRIEKAVGMLLEGKSHK